MRPSAILQLALVACANALPVRHRLTSFNKSFIRSHPRFIPRDVNSPPIESLSAFTTPSSSMPAVTASASSIASSAISTSVSLASSVSLSTLSPQPATSSIPVTAINTSVSVASTPTLPSASASPATPSASNGTQKFVIAHHMVGNTFPYTLDNWASDIALAHANGIDGFALNVGSDSWQPGQVANAYQAASQSGTNFKLFLSFDMSALPCAGPNDAAALRKYITTYAKHPNQLIYNGRVFASTFSGESCAFGQSSPAAGWSSQFTQHPDLSGQNAVWFVPAFFVDPNTFGTFNNVMDGVLNWNSGWPVQLTTNSANSVLASVGASLSSIVSSITNTVSNTLSQFVNGTTSDSQFIDGLNKMPSNGEKRSYMAAVSPWFFTHYSPQSFNKNFIYYTDSHLYPTRWESLINTRDQIDLVEIATWNDYGESHYIGPIEGAQPNSQAWTNGMNHTGWLDMTKYYAEAFKTGAYPPVTEDKLYMWSRPHSRDANAPDPVGKPSNFQLTEDTVWVVAMTSAPATVTLATSDSNTQTFNVPAGANKLSVPISAGGFMHGTIQRGGQTVVDLKPEDFTFEGSPGMYNYNAFVAFAGANS
ncbi:hypothetical protein EVG20_g4369 [Dentipellis fragilis]|uniref:Glycoside hydrolase family 71 protein n=1 Tax=Dentipellis fragilis TaxID=205917 RepID=A0A4Y9Z019_9AGAM|nr:hypothetical protein EVG20_g4369 [Dentipellis fragilis]